MVLLQGMHAHFSNLLCGIVGELTLDFGILSVAVDDLIVLHGMKVGLFG